MQSLPENSILRLPPGALYDIRKIHNLDKPERIDQAVDILEAWIQKQDHIIKKDFRERIAVFGCLNNTSIPELSLFRLPIEQEREYLEKTLITCKGSVEKSKKQIDRLCTMKTLIPKFFLKTNVKMELQDVLSLAKLVPLPVVTDDYYRIILIRITDKDITNEGFVQFFQFCIIMAEYIKANDYINGYKIIYDCRQMNVFDVISKINTMELQQFITILIEGYGARLHSIHMLTESKAIELMINIVKQFVSEKIGNRMHVQRSLQDLHKEVPRELLPAEYGGKQKSVEMLHAELVQELSSVKHVEYAKMMFQACSDETKRHAGKFNEEYMGMPGAFRNLSVD